MDTLSTQGFFEKHTALLGLKDAVEELIALITEIKKPNKVMVCGNGGSCADAQHIVGELMKAFKAKRPSENTFKNIFGKTFPGENLPEYLQGAIPAISLFGDSALISAIINDTGADYLFAQQVYGLGVSGDILIAISTSGNSVSVINALKTAKALGVTTAGLTGGTGGKMREYCDILLNVPETETYKIQELHLPLYHYICAEAESRRWK